MGITYLFGACKMVGEGEKALFEESITYWCCILKLLLIYHYAGNVAICDMLIRYIFNNFVNFELDKWSVHQAGADLHVILSQHSIVFTVLFCYCLNHSLSTFHLYYIILIS